MSVPQTPLEKYADEVFKTHDSSEFKIEPHRIIDKINKEQLTNFNIIDILSIINKGIYFLYKLNIIYSNGELSDYYLPHYKEIHKYSPVMLSSYRARNKQIYGFKFSPTIFLQCNTRHHCLTEDNLENIILLPYIVDDVTGIYIIYYDHPIGIIFDNTDFYNKLNAREAALYILLMDYYRSFISANISLSPNQIVLPPRENRGNLRVLTEGSNIPNYLPPNIAEMHEYKPTNTLVNKDIIISAINKNIVYFGNIKRYRNRNDYTIPETTQVALDSIVAGLKCGNRCVKEETLPNISLEPAKIGDETVIYIHLDNRARVGCFIRDPSYINSLTDKERAFIDFLFTHIEELNSGKTLNSYMFFNGVNLSNSMTPPNVKFNDRKLRFSNNVNVRYIPWTAKAKQGGVRRRRRTHKRRKHLVKVNE